METLRSLRHRNYRLYFFGQSISLVGTWMQTTAQAWLVYRLTHSAFLLGLVGFAGQIPVLLFGLLGGTVADRIDRRRLLVWTQSAALAQAAILAALTFGGIVKVWDVFFLAAALGLINVFDMPARQAFVPELVGPEDMGNAIAVNGFMVNGSRMVGPAVAGLLIGLFGEGVCFLLNALSYIAVIASLLMMRLPASPEKPEDSLQESLAQTKAGLKYSLGDPAMRNIYVLLSLLSLAGVPFMALMPIFTEKILHGGAGSMGLLMAATGIGSVISSWLLAQKRGYEGLGFWVGAASAVFGVSLIAFAFSNNFSLSLALLVPTGAGMMAAFAGANTLLQSLTSNEMRGRVMGLFGMTFMGVAPLGSLISGFIAERVGAPATVAGGGVLCLVAGLMFLQEQGEALPLESASI